VTYGPGGSFGELALLHSVPRAATVSTTEPTSVWIMERKYYTYFKRQYFKTVRLAPIAHTRSATPEGLFTSALHLQPGRAELNGSNYRASWC
jgi:hypothetical protein